ncbi:uncharacterized protein MELLADRAFT_91841 [Melampsora larici-populina 98AG31]|uniref:Uncharacterized protein n=1 Tax=Melampsora larici-populina (strain 98AG31 / pathotype 3-4-7) TaxID=747676 RepID=F4S0J3_MELLP|nr:uncharacterized protein MELLADRAFT_91841 [Melampsora larici-populina 98AG31]EGG01859.1 hypothetical protein MELLADRAFT_91841 [Melampsora larici-populina 98AG31]
MTSHATGSAVAPVKVNNTQSISPPTTTTTTPITTPITNKAINNTTPTTNPVLPSTITPSPSPSPSNQNQNQNQDRLVSSSNNEIITQSSVVSSPQTIPVEPLASSSSSLSNTTTNDKNALPVVAVVIIAIVGSVIGLFIVYRIYRRLFYKFQNHRSTKPPNKKSTKNPIEGSHHDGYDHSSVSQIISHHQIGSQHQYHSKASLARHSIYYPHSGNQYHHVEEQISDLGSYSIGIKSLNQAVQGDHQDENRSMSSSLLPFAHHDESQKTSPTNLNTNQELMIGLESGSDDSRQILLGPPSHSNGRISPLPMNPLLLTKDHSTLSTNTLKQATRRQSILSHQHSVSRNGSTDFGPSMMDHRISTYPAQQPPRSNSRTSLYAGPQSRSNSRIGTYASQQSRSNSRISNSVGLPHLTKPRYQLTLPTPLSKPTETFMNAPYQTDRSFQSDSHPSGSNHRHDLHHQQLDEFEINSFTQQQLHYQNDDHYGSIPLHSQIGSLSGEDHDEFVNPNESGGGGGGGGTAGGNLKHHDHSVGTSPLDLLKIQFAHQPHSLIEMIIRMREVCRNKQVFRGMSSSGLTNRPFVKLIMAFGDIIRFEDF